MARTSYFTGFPLNQNQSVYVEDVIRQLGDLYTDTEEILNTTIDARDQAQASAQSATASENAATTAKDDALVAKQEAQDAAYDAQQDRLQAQQAAEDAEGFSQIAASSAATATDVLDQVTNLYGDVTEIQDAVTTAVDAKDEAATSATAAAGSASAAAQSASSASSSASDAALSAADAQTFRNAAQAARNQAQTARNEAQTAQQAAEAAATAAEGHASDASSSASSAATSATEAAGSASDAQTYRQQAVNARNAAQTARDEAQTAQAAAESAAQSAATSASDAASEATAAAASANAAEGSASDAATSASSAAASATSAGQAAEDAEGHASQAQTFRNQAQTARNQAQTARDAAQTAAGEAATSASDASDSANAAAGSASDAAQSAADAEAAAQEAVNTVADTAKKTQNLSDLANLKEANANLGIFSSVADVQNSQIAPELDSIRTNGYYGPGDGGGALYKRVTTEPSHAGKIQSADGAWWEIAETVINVRQFGAKGDYDPENRTGTDDTAAFNAASALIREALRSSSKNKLTDRVIVIPPGNYLVTSVDFTDLRATAQLGQTCTVLGYGAYLYCKTPGAVAVDLTNSLGISLEGLSVIGDELSPPRVGIQLARGITGLSAGRHRLQSVVVAGHYTLSSVYNFASEREHVSDCQFTNNYPSTTAYAYALDGVNWHEATSAYFQPEQPKYTPQSNLSHYFEQTTFSKGQGTSGSPIWLCRFGRLRMVNCYAVTRDDYGVIIETDSAIVEGCYLDLHIEMLGSKGSIKFVPLDPVNINTNRRIRIDNFTFLENTIHGNEAVLRASAGDEITLRNANISVLNERPGNAGQYNFAIPLSAFQILNGNVQMSVGQNDYGFPKGTYNIIHGNNAYTKGSAVSVSQFNANFATQNVDDLDKAEFINGNVHVDFSGTGTTPFVVTRNGEEKFTIRVANSGEQVTFVMDRGSPNERIPLVFRPGGALGIPRLSSPPSSATGGDLYYDTSLDKLRVYIGGATQDWVSLN